MILAEKNEKRFQMKRGKREITEALELTYQERITTQREKENYKYLEILEMNTTKQVEKK